MKQPTQETVKKIDYIIQGLEDGRFAEISKAVEFHQKLKGDDEPTYFTDLINELQSARKDILDLEDRIRPLEDMQRRVMDMETLMSNYNRDMRGVANALLMITNPDPFNQGNTIDTVAAENFVDDYKNKY